MRRPTAMFVAVLWLGAVRVVAAQPDQGATAEQPTAGGAVVEPPAADGALAAQQDADDAPVPEPGDEVAPAAEQAVDGRPAVQTLGDGPQKLYVVNHGGTWSMHVEAMVTDELVRLWNQVGGPQVVAKTVLDRPYNISVHKKPAERILETLLDGFDYTLHYDADGRLERVRVYSLDPSSASTFRTPRLVESLASWRDLETAEPSPPAAPVPEAEAASPSVP